MGYPADLVYTDLTVPFVRLSNLESAYASSISGTPFQTTIGDPYDWSAAALAVPLSGGRVATCYFKEIIDEATGSVVYGPIAGWYAVECVITSGLTIVGRHTVDLPASPLDYDTNFTPLVRGGQVCTGFNYAFNAAGAGDYVVIGAALFDLNSNTSPVTKWYGAEWLVLLDCSGNTPVVADTYLRAETSDDLSSPPQLFPPTGSNEIRLVPMDDQRVVTVMLNPDYVGDIAESSLFSIKVSNGALEFQNNGYPTTTGSYDFSQSYDVFLGYDSVSNVGLFTDNYQASFGFSFNAAGTNTTFGTTTPSSILGSGASWIFEGHEYNPWGAAGDYVPSSIEPGVFYGPVFINDFPDPEQGNPTHTAKFRYTGSGEVEMLAVTPALPHPDLSWQYQWNASPGSGWRCVEYNGKVVVATPIFYWDGTESLYDLFLCDDAFGTPAFYRVANLSGVGATSSGSGYDLTLILQGGTLYMPVNVSDAYQSDLLVAGEDYGTIVAMTIVNFNQTDIDGELAEKERKFWRPRPGW